MVEIALQWMIDPTHCISVPGLGTWGLSPEEVDHVHDMDISISNGNGNHIISYFKIYIHYFK